MSLAKEAEQCAEETIDFLDKWLVEAIKSLTAEDVAKGMPASEEDASETMIKCIGIMAMLQSSFRPEIVIVRLMAIISNITENDIQKSRLQNLVQQIRN